ncbi:hypothetical protein PSAC2689_30087 [Paraburkholderia sacchari]
MSVARCGGLARCRASAVNLGGPELNNLLRDIPVVSVKSPVSCRAAVRRHVAPARRTRAHP